LLIVLLVAARRYGNPRAAGGHVVLALWYFTLAAVLFGLARQHSPS
jgi:hypothetical protein